MILTGAQIPMTHSHSLRRVALGLLIAGVTLLSGCVTKRYVTHVTWLDQDTFYVAYSEVDRKILAELAVHEPASFAAICEQAKAQLQAA